MRLLLSCLLGKCDHFECKLERMAEFLSPGQHARVMAAHRRGVAAQSRTQESKQ